MSRLGRALDRHDVAAALTQAAATINAPASVEETLSAIVHTALRSLEGIDHVGVSIPHRGGRVETAAATDPLVWQLDQLQYERGEGPCLYAIEAGPTVLIEHAARDDRWPGFMTEAVRLGMRSQLGLRLYADDSTLGGLNMYSTSSDTIDAETVSMAELFATHAAIALGKARTYEQLTTALNTRRTVGMAIGLVMERYGLDEARAFSFLARASQTSNVKLRDVAQSMVEEANTRASHDGPPVARLPHLDGEVPTEPA